MSDNWKTRTNGCAQWATRRQPQVNNEVSEAVFLTQGFSSMRARTGRGRVPSPWVTTNSHLCTLRQPRTCACFEDRILDLLGI